MSDIDPSVIAAIAGAAANQKRTTGGRFTVGEFLFALMTYFAAAVSIVFIIGCLTRLAQ